MNGRERGRKSLCTVKRKREDGKKTMILYKHMQCCFFSAGKTRTKKMQTDQFI